MTEFKSDHLIPLSCQTNRPGSRDAIASKKWIVIYWKVACWECNWSLVLVCGTIGYGLIYQSRNPGSIGCGDVGSSVSFYQFYSETYN